MKVFEWIKEHKMELLIAAGTVALGGICLYKCSNTKSKIELGTSSKPSIGPKKIPLTCFGVGACDDALKYNDGTVELWLDNINLDQMGDLGDEIANCIPELPENPNVWALLCIREDRQ